MGNKTYSIEKESSKRNRRIRRNMGTDRGDLSETIPEEEVRARALCRGRLIKGKCWSGREKDGTGVDSSRLSGAEEHKRKKEIPKGGGDGGSASTLRIN